MRKHCSYYYKSFDRVNLSEFDKINNEYFNEYGFNLGSNKNREFDYDSLIEKTNCKTRKKVINPKEKY